MSMLAMGFEFTSDYMVWVLRVSAVVLFLWRFLQPLISLISRKIESWLIRRKQKDNVSVLSENGPLRITANPTCIEDLDASKPGRTSTARFTREELLGARFRVDMTPPVSLKGIHVEQLPLCDNKRRDLTTSSCGDISHDTLVDVEARKELIASLLEFRAFPASNFDNAASSIQWNNAAQKILRGSLIIPAKNVALDVYDTLTSAGIMADMDTFTLLIESCIASNNLKCGREFFDRMTNAGYHLPHHLADIISPLPPVNPKFHCSLNRDAPVFIPKCQPHREHFRS